MLPVLPSQRGGATAASRLPVPLPGQASCSQAAAGSIAPGLSKPRMPGRKRAQPEQEAQDADRQGLAAWLGSQDGSTGPSSLRGGCREVQEQEQEQEEGSEHDEEEEPAQVEPLHPQSQRAHHSLTGGLLQQPVRKRAKGGKAGSGSLLGSPGVLLPRWLLRRGRGAEAGGWLQAGSRRPAATRRSAALPRCEAQCCACPWCLRQHCRSAWLCTGRAPGRIHAQQSPHS